MVRNGNTWTFYKDGVAVGTFSDTLTMTNGDNVDLKIGIFGDDTRDFDGYQDSLIIAKSAIYTTGFTPPTAYYGVTASATGNYVSTATTANASVSTMGAVITYKNQSGTNTLNTDIVLEVSANGGSNYTTAVLTAAGTFSTGILQAVANDISVTAGTSIIYRISFANQSDGVKVAQIYGASLMY